MTPQLLLTHAIHPALALLPPAMASDGARAMLLAIALQESRCAKRRQVGGGPARGFWQFEREGGVAGVLAHRKTRPVIGQVLETLCYPVYADACYGAIEHNDVLAACFARLLLWTVPMPLPGREQLAAGWANYIAGWRPGKPHRKTWDGFYAAAWDMVDPKGVTQK